MTRTSKGCPDLKDIAKRRSDSGQLTDLEIEAGETRVLSPTASSSKSCFERIPIENVADLKALVGVPASVSIPARNPALDDCRRRLQRDKDRCDDREASGSAAIAAVRPLARTIDPAVLNRSEDDPERREAVQIARAALEDHLYANAPLASTTLDLVHAYVKLRSPIVFASVLGNITVHDKATLNVSAGTLLLQANRVRLFGSGRIVCQGPTTFRVHDVRGNISTGGGGIIGSGDILSEPIQPIDF